MSSKPIQIADPQSRPHVAIIMDGSGRWATARGMPRLVGHRAGRAAVRRTILAALAENISILTLFTFSTDNWGRPEREVAELMQTFEDFFRNDAPLLAAEGARISVIGRRDRLPATLLEAIQSAEAMSASNPRLSVRLAIDYSGRDAILTAARHIQESSLWSSEDFANVIADGGSTGGTVPDIDLLIRTGGELRLSNCPLWEIAYAELYFTPCLWPDFGATELAIALDDFYSRERRFGRVPGDLLAATIKLCIPD
jgi:undecaprenyl diphosphate synthase